MADRLHHSGGGGNRLGGCNYSISDVPEGELLIPLFIAEHQGKRQVLRFEAATQEEAISTAKRHVDSVDGTLDLWSLSREGSMPIQDGTRLDVISVEASAAAFHHRLLVVQPFRPAHLPSGFGLLGQPVLALDGEEVSPDTLPRYCQIIEEGLRAIQPPRPWPASHLHHHFLPMTETPNPELQRTGRERRRCNRCVPCAGSPILGR